MSNSAIFTFCARAIGPGLWLPLIAAAAVLAGCPEKQRLMPDRGRTSASKGTRAVTSSLNIFARPAFAYAKQGPKQVSIADIAERCVRSVVNVRATKAPRGRQPLFGPHPLYGPPSQRRARSLGSGVILSADGVVLTNHHVVKQTREIFLTLTDERELVAEIVGSDPKADLAVLRIKGDVPKDLVPLPVGNSDALRLGEVVLAIGNPFGVGQTVTMGIVSAKGRADMGIVDYEDFIQTDAAINPGNSGGALVNMRGELVGINTAILSRSGGYQGIGFSIPTKMAKPIMESLLKHGRVVRGWLGVVIQNLTKELAAVIDVPVVQGVLVSQVQAGGPAAKAGLARGDVIVEFDGKKLRSVAELRNAVALKGTGVKVELAIYRGRQRRKLTVTLDELPGEKVATFAPGQGALGGMTVSPLDDRTRRRVRLPRDVGGVVVTRLSSGSAAAAAGIREGDVIAEINRRPVANAAQFERFYRQTKGKILLLVVREEGAMYLMLEK